MKFKSRFSKGFTLVEVMIVIIIIGVLAALVFTLYRGQISKANDAKRKSDLDRIKVAAEEYEKDHNCYPPPQLLSCNPGSGLQPYLDKIPCDPVTKASYFYEYENSVCPSWYRLYAKLDYTADPQAMAWCGGPTNNSFNYYVSSPNAPACVSASSTPGGGGVIVGGGASPTPASGPHTYYGCINGTCTAISWDASRPGPACDPNYQSSDCYDQCGQPAFECKPWK